jgi:hypothetical protein
MALKWPMANVCTKFVKDLPIDSNIGIGRHKSHDDKE